ncbi:hypothetical protein [Leifsonia sp. Root227]|uniref:hypothetical protein n=1 Tax=Leifsonia sp. Root227 TaxID=1736496 RepID=UPI0012F8DAF0|nr:hypothetical protein [Leifsonia sp. Root227]
MEHLYTAQMRMPSGTTVVAVAETINGEPQPRVRFETKTLGATTSGWAVPLTEQANWPSSCQYRAMTPAEITLDNAAL